MISLFRTSILPFFIRNRYRKEMTLVLSIKLLGLVLLWGLFFSHPQTHSLKKNQLNDRFIGRHHTLT